jgi:hypothetical protein
MAKKTDAKAGSEGKALGPSTFMRARRPEQFSDSDRETSPVIERSLLEYHLETLTNRNDERPFESFARKLAQREICPNLIPQTGPTGGGDSKVDTETYPVAPEVSERWYEGHPNAGSERWAFAISAKRDWKPKVRSDIQKIADTNRGYSSIYFISNQFIKDKDRSVFEDELTRQHGVPVRILDRNWIVDKVFERKHFDIAIDALNIGVTVQPNSSRLGAQDSAKQIQLNELESRIGNPENYAGADYLLAEDCLGVRDSNHSGTVEIGKP